MEIDNLSYQLKYYPPDKFLKLVKRKLLKTPPIESFEPEHPCVFVLSTGRVGSQTLAHLCMQAKNVFAYHEAEPQLFGLSALAYELFDPNRSEEPLNRLLQEGFLTARKDLLDLSLYCAKGYIETGPHATFLAPTILSLFPGVRFIHLVRSPRDVVRSGMRRKWYGGHHYDPYRIQPNADSPFQMMWQDMNAFDRNIWLWAETNHWIMKFFQTLPAVQTITIRSEDIFTGHEKTIQDLFDFIGSEMPKKAKMNRILNRKMNAQQTGVFKVPAGWLESTSDSLKRFLREIASQLGYEIE